MPTEAEFTALVDAHRRELHAHCYRMLGSVQDAEDALQNALLGAWQGIAGFEGRASARTWLYRIATNACLRILEQRPRRLLSPDIAPARESVHDLGQWRGEPVWLEPYPLDPAAGYEQRESVELAFVAALQHLPATQRAVLVLREVLRFSAAEVAQQLDTTVASVNSALQRARKTLDERAVTSQQAELAALGDHGRRELVAAFISAWERADVAALTELLVEDARVSMPPLPAWLAGREMVARFYRDRVFATSWRILPAEANGQLAVGAYQSPDYQLVHIVVLSVRDGRFSDITAFLDPEVYGRFGLPEKVPADR